MNLEEIAGTMSKGTGIRFILLKCIIAVMKWSDKKVYFIICNFPSLPQAVTILSTSTKFYSSLVMKHKKQTHFLFHTSPIKMIYIQQFTNVNIKIIQKSMHFSEACPKLKYLPFHVLKALLASSLALFNNSTARFGLK